MLTVWYTCHTVSFGMVSRHASTVPRAKLGIWQFRKTAGRRSMDYVTLAVRCLIGFTFGTAAISKLRGRTAHTEFVVATATLLSALLAGRTPRWSAARSLAAVVVGAELAIVVLLVFPATASLGFCLAAALLVAFCLAIASAIRGGVRAACHCFGASSAPVGRTHLVRNGLLLVASLAGWGLGTGGVGRLEPVGVVVAAASGLVLAAALARLDDLVALLRPPPGTGGRPLPGRGGAGPVRSAR